MVNSRHIYNSIRGDDNAIDWKMKNEIIKKNKKRPYQQLSTDIWVAGLFLGKKFKTNIYAWLANPFVEKYLKEGKNYEYDHKDLMDGLAYARALSVMEDTDSDIFKKVYQKKQAKLKDEKIGDDEMKNEINQILSKNLGKEENNKNKNLQSYLLQCRKSLVGYSVDPNDKNRFANEQSKKDFDDKVGRLTIEDIALNKLSLMIMRDYFEAYFNENKNQLNWDNFKVRVANNYDNMMWWSHLIVWFRHAKTGNEKHFALNINTQWSHKKLPDEITPYDFSSSLNTDGKWKKINMSMKTLDWWNKELFYKFIWNAVETIKNKWSLDDKDIMDVFEKSAKNPKSVEHIKAKIIELLTQDSKLAA